MKPRATAAAWATLLTGCTFGTATDSLPARLNIAGFGFDVPRAPGWRVAAEHTATMEAVRFVRDVAAEEDRTHQLEVQAFVPIESVADQTAIVRWARGKGEGREARPAEGHGAVCARYEDRWLQRLSFDGREAPSPTHEIQDHGLFCIHPSGDGRLVHLRASERAAIGHSLGAFDGMAQALLQSVRWEGGLSTVPR